MFPSLLPISRKIADGSPVIFIIRSSTSFPPIISCTPNYHFHPARSSLTLLLFHLFSSLPSFFLRPIRVSKGSAPPIEPPLPSISLVSWTIALFIFPALSLVRETSSLPLSLLCRPLISSFPLSHLLHFFPPPPPLPSPLLPFLMTPLPHSEMGLEGFHHQAFDISHSWHCQLNSLDCHHCDNRSYADMSVLFSWWPHYLILKWVWKRGFHHSTFDIVKWHSSSL